MSTPINDFVKKYADSKTVRFHMPGHKGRKFHGMEPFDITEIKGADYLFDADGIIGESEKHMSKAFDTAETLYSTEGSSLCIKTMLGIIKLNMKNPSEKMLVIAPRNVHKAFINACILLDADVKWVYPEKPCTSVCSGGVTSEDIKRAIDECEKIPDCVYVTSPDYLGNISDIKGISEVCRAKSIPLLCDNAHGAYLNFLEENIHPMALGADMCCDSAHKTLPCYTGGALLHISKNAPKDFISCAKNAMSLFASTSPSYLIMESLDLCSDYVNKNYRNDLSAAVRRTAECKKRLEKLGWILYGNEPAKITVCAGESGYDGDELGNILREKGIEPEYTDCQYAVFMITPFNSEEDFLALEKAMSEIPQLSAIPKNDYPFIPHAVKKMNIREAAFSKSCAVPVEKALGRICGMTVTCCQPSVPIAVSGEEITDDVIKILKRYSISQINVI